MLTPCSAVRPPRQIRARTRSAVTDVSAQPGQSRPCCRAGRRRGNEYGVGTSLRRPSDSVGEKSDGCASYFNGLEIEVEGGGLWRVQQPRFAPPVHVSLSFQHPRSECGLDRTLRLLLT